MREAYRQARRVLIWLGEEGGDALEPLIKLARKLATVDASTLPKDRVARQKSLGFRMPIFFPCLLCWRNLGSDGSGSYRKLQLPTKLSCTVDTNR